MIKSILTIAIIASFFGFAWLLIKSLLSIKNDIKKRKFNLTNIIVFCIIVGFWIGVAYIEMKAITNLQGG